MRSDHVLGFTDAHTWLTGTSHCCSTGNAAETGVLRHTRRCAGDKGASNAAAQRRSSALHRMRVASSIRVDEWPLGSDRFVLVAHSYIKL